VRASQSAQSLVCYHVDYVCRASPMTNPGGGSLVQWPSIPIYIRWLYWAVCPLYSLLAMEFILMCAIMF